MASESSEIWPAASIISTQVLFTSCVPLHFEPLRDIVRRIDPSLAQALKPATTGGEQLLVQAGPVAVMLEARARPLTGEEVALATQPTSP